MRAVVPAPPSSFGFSARATRPIIVGMNANIAIIIAESMEAFWAVFPSSEEENLLTISGPDRNVQK